MYIETELSELNTGLRELYTFSDVIGNEIRNAGDSQISVDFANALLSYLSMQSAKVDKLIEIAEKLEQGKDNEQAD